MARREFEFHPDVGSGRVGLAVVELQVLHWGHVQLLTNMLGSCDTGIVALGSCQKSGVPGHPFGVETRQAMVQGVFGPRFKFVQLQDIDASIDNDEWMQYVLGRITGMGLPEPTDYFTGSSIEAHWYENFFASTRDPAEANGIVTTHTSPVTRRRLHVVDRAKTGILSARELRFLIERRDPGWMPHVPPRLWRFIEQNYPPHLRQAIRIEQGGPMPGGVPVGTRAIVAGREGVLELKDDGRWRPLRGTVDEKAAHAQRTGSGG